MRPTLSERAEADFLMWFQFTYGNQANYAKNETIMAVARAAWAAATALSQEAVAKEIGDVAGDIATGATDVSDYSKSQVVFGLCKMLRGKKS